MESGARRPELPEPQWETVVETRRDVAAVPIAADSELARRSSERPAELERTLSGPPELVSSRSTSQSGLHQIADRSGGAMEGRCCFCF